jgi:hypothetical protein
MAETVVLVGATWQKEQRRQQQSCGRNPAKVEYVTNSYRILAARTYAFRSPDMNIYNYTMLWYPNYMGQFCTSATNLVIFTTFKAPKFLCVS